VCEECDFEANNKHNILNHKYNEHQVDSENDSDAEEDESPNYQCDLCAYNSGWPDNVAFHYREIHNIQMNSKEAELRLKRI
jgi:hypothetical protein